MLEDHELGNLDCPVCWTTYPVCWECNQGIVHTEYIDEDWDNVYLNYICENCELVLPP